MDRQEDPDLVDAMVLPAVILGRLGEIMMVHQGVVVIKMVLLVGIVTGLLPVRAVDQLITTVVEVVGDLTDRVLEGTDLTVIVQEVMIIATVIVTRVKIPHDEIKIVTDDKFVLPKQKVNMENSEFSNHIAMTIKMER